MKLIAALVIVETTLLLLSRVDTEIIAKRKSGYVGNVIYYAIL